VTYTAWQKVEGEGLAFDEIVYEKKHHTELKGGIARVTINKPDKLNTMTMHTVDEMFRAFYDADHDPTVGVVVVAGAGKHFGTGGDVEWERWGLRAAFYNRYPHNRLIRLSRKPVIAQVQGYCLGGHNHMAYVCDFTIAADNAIFGQVGPKMGSFDGGFGSSYLARSVGQKKAREIWFLCRQYNAREALDMGLVNTVVPVASLEAEGVKWANEILEKSPLAIRLLKSGFNAELDGQAGIQELAGNATMLYYMVDEAKEFMTAQREKRKPDARKYPWLP
jgi:naphthoate synthase/2-ketocyclohexanecarboxyl-CoA hydrolase